jgi:hypothetical protein
LGCQLINARVKEATKDNRKEEKQANLNEALN